MNKRCIHLAARAHIVGWIKRDVGTIDVGFAYFKAPAKLVIETKLANPTRLVADRRKMQSHLEDIVPLLKAAEKGLYTYKSN